MILTDQKKKKKLPMFQLVQADAIVYFVFSFNSHHFDQHHFQQSPTVFTLSSISLSYKGLFTYGGGGFWTPPPPWRREQREREQRQSTDRVTQYTKKKKKKDQKGRKSKTFLGHKMDSHKVKPWWRMGISVSILEQYNQLPGAGGTSLVCIILLIDEV